MKHLKISVIVPLYNTEDYVGEALDSVLRQTMPDFEVIVINDGSTDNGLAVVEEMARQDSRVRVFSQANQGLSISRNVGIGHARGEFIYFFDSDDLLEPRAFEILYNECVENALDFVFFDADSFVDRGCSLKEIDYERNIELEAKVCKGPDVLMKLLKENSYRAPVWMNLIRASFLRKAGLDFYPKIIHEDELFTVKLFLNADRVGYMPYILIHRRMRLNSIMTQNITWKNIHGYTAVVRELMSYRGRVDKYRQKIIDVFLNRTVNAVLKKSNRLTLKKKMRILRESCKGGSLKYTRLYSWLVMFLKTDS